MAEIDRTRLGEDVRQQLGMNLEASSHRFDSIDPTFSAEVDRVVAAEKITRSAAMDRTIKARPDLWELAKHATAAQVV